MISVIWKQRLFCIPKVNNAKHTAYCDYWWEESFVDASIKKLQAKRLIREFKNQYRLIKIKRLIQIEKSIAVFPLPF